MEWEDAPAGKSQPTASSPTKGGWEDAPSQGTGQPPTQTMGQRIAGTAASFADIFTGFAGMMIQIPVAAGAEITGALFSPLTGETSKEILKGGKRIGESVDPVSGLAMRTVVGLSGGDPANYDQNIVEHTMGKVGEKIKQLGDYLEGKTEGMLPSEATEQFTNALMLKIPGLSKDAAKFATRKIFDERAAVREAKAKAAEEKMGEGYKKEPEVKFEPAPTNEEIVRMKKEVDKHRTAEQQAYELMQRGASTREVERAVEKNPLLAEKMDEIRRRRGNAKESFNRAQQGEHLGPEERVATEAAKESMDALPQPNANAKPLSALKSQRGEADPRLLAGLGLVVGGAALGYGLASQDKLEGALTGGIAGAALLHLPRYINALKADWKSTLKTTTGVATVGAGATYLDKEHPVEGAMLGALYGSTKLLPKAAIPKIGDMTIDEHMNLYFGAIEAKKRQTDNVARVIEDAVPDRARREALSHAAESGNMSGLSEREQKTVQHFRSFMDSFGDAAKDVGLIQDLVHNYVTHIVEKQGAPATKVEEVMKAFFPEGAVGQGASRFAKARKYATFSDLQTALEGSGLRVKTMDMAEIVRIYGDSMGRAIENKRLVDNLKGGKLEGGEATVTPADRAPPGYVPMNHPQLRGMYVHPEIARSLKFALGAGDAGEITRGLLATSLAQKRLVTGLSMFHASNLLNAYAGAMGTDIVRMKSAVDAALKLYRDGGSGDVVDRGLRNGLTVGKPLEADLDAMKKLGALADGYIERLTGVKQSVGEKGLGAVERLQKETFDKVTWDYLQPGMKLAVYLKAYEKGLLDHPKMSPDEVARQAASFANDTFGGLNWYRVAAESESQLGRRLAMGLMSPAGRRAMQVMMFAPDWTFSTFRAMYKGLPGATKMPLTAQLHRNYLMRTALIYATLMNGYNMAVNNGQFIWDNKDPTKIQYADGTTQQVAKHAMEGAEWVLNPRKTFLNKFGFIPKEMAEQAMGVEYLSEKGVAPKMESRLGHALGGVAPLPWKQEGDTFFEKGKRIGLSMGGLPVYGLEKEKREELKRTKKEERRRRKMEEFEE